MVSRRPSNKVLPQPDGWQKWCIIGAKKGGNKRKAIAYLLAEKIFFR
jgi:hypothetical protein